MYYVECEGLQVHWFIHQSSDSLHRGAKSVNAAGARVCARACVHVHVANERARQACAERQGD